MIFNNIILQIVTYKFDIHHTTIYVALSSSLYSIRIRNKDTPNWDHSSRRQLIQ